MRTMNERPVCHRSEDLVTYLYNEASAAEAQDFANHVEKCEACRAEFAVFSEVRESIPSIRAACPQAAGPRGTERVLQRLATLAARRDGICRAAALCAGGVDNFADVSKPTSSSEKRNAT